MVPIIVGGPAVEPVSLPEMRAYLRLDDGAEDGLLSALVRAARLTVEAAAGVVLLETRFRLVLDRWPRGLSVRLPVAPLIAVEHVRVVDRGGTARDLAAELWEADPDSSPPRLTIDAAAPQPGRRRRGIEVVLAAGYGRAPEDAPEPLRQAVRLLAAHWFEHRGDESRPWPADLHALVAPFRHPRL